MNKINVLDIFKNFIVFYGIEDTLKLINLDKYIKSKIDNPNLIENIYATSIEIANLFDYNILIYELKEIILTVFYEKMNEYE